MDMTESKVFLPVEHLDAWSEEFPLFKVESKNFHKHFFLKRFQEIPDAPKEIYFRGKFPREETHFLAVVGSRDISDYGKEACKKILEGIKGQNICIISGLALGTDGEALNAGLANKLHTIAIPGSGLSERLIAPRTNKDIAFNILKSGGLLLSEFPPDYQTQVWSFPQRNRIMASLCDAVLLIEASLKSGDAHYSKTCSRIQ
jgi:DNA processing protein